MPHAQRDWNQSNQARPAPLPTTTEKKMAFEENTQPLTTAAGAPVTDNQNSMSAGPRGPLRPRSHTRAAHARQGFRRLRNVSGDPRHLPVHESGDLQPGRQQL